MWCPTRIFLIGMSFVAAVALCARAADDATPKAKDRDPSAIDVDLKKAKWKVPESIKELFGYDEPQERLFFFANGSAEFLVKLPADGKYEIVVTASGTRAEKELARFKLACDAKTVGKETELKEEAEKEYTFAANLKAGERKLSIEFTNDLYKEGEYDRNLFIHALAVKKAK
jgi:Ca-dependent carbohydrate-binding module xylan-binding